MLCVRVYCDECTYGVWYGAYVEARGGRGGSVTHYSRGSASSLSPHYSEVWEFHFPLSLGSGSPHTGFLCGPLHPHLLQIVDDGSDGLLHDAHKLHLLWLLKQ